MVDDTGYVGNGVIVDAGCVSDGLISNTGCVGGGFIAEADCAGDGLIANAGCADDGLIRRPNGWCLVRWVWAWRARMWRRMGGRLGQGQCQWVIFTFLLARLNGWPSRPRPLPMGQIDLLNGLSQ